MRLGSTVFLAATLLVAATAARAQESGWQDAVGQLSRERSQAEACAGALKKYGTPAAKARGAVVYAAAKSEYDGVVAGLDAAVARKGRAPSLGDLDARMQRGFYQREAFCNSVKPLIPSTGPERIWMADIAKATLQPLIEALKDIYDGVKDDDADTRAAIQTQLDDAKWSPFAAVAPLS